MAFSRFGHLKLGKDNEEPAFNNATWFSMLFCSGIGIGEFLHLAVSSRPGPSVPENNNLALFLFLLPGLYFYGVSEPIFELREQALKGSVPE